MMTHITSVILFQIAAIHTLLQVHGRHFCVIAASDYPSLGELQILSTRY